MFLYRLSLWRCKYMTIFQKEKILQLRSRGASYSEIAKVVGLPRNTVKSFCRRNTASTEMIITEPNLSGCRECGKPLVQVSGRKRRIFCSKECREKWWHAHPEKIRQRAVYTFTCPECGNTFTAYGNRHRKYCSHRCYICDRFGGNANEKK